MRIVMWLRIHEDDPMARAVEFYHLLSSFDYMASIRRFLTPGPLLQLSSVI